MSPADLLKAPEFLLALGTLFLSFVTSAAEAALYDLSQGKEGSRLRGRLKALLSRPQRLADVLRTLDFFSDVAFLLSLGVLYARTSPYNRGFDLFLLFVAVPLLFVASEAIPRAIGSRWPKQVIRSTLLPIELMATLLGPIASASREICGWLLTPLSKRMQEGTQPDEEELRAVLGYSARKGELGQEGVEMVEGIFALDEYRVNQVMTPRTKIIFLPEDSTWEETLDAFRSSPYRRLPIRGETLDDVRGVLYAKDMLTTFVAGQRPTPIQMAREPLFVPGVAHLDDALDRLREAGNQLAMVIDEYGGIEGVVTMEDILEVIVGEIRDEHDEREVREDAVAVRRRKNGYDLAGSLELEELSELLEVPFEEIHVETDGGLVFHEFGSLPEVGDQVEIEGYLFRVTSRDRNRIDRVLVRKAAKRA